MIPQPQPAIEITRRGFVQAGGALFVSLALLPRASGAAATETSPLLSWLEIRSDNTILVRTGRSEIGTGMSGFYTQVVAEELSVSPESITLIMGDTDKTPDGGYSAGFLSGASNVRKVAAYAFQALLLLAAKQLAFPMNALKANNSSISGGGKSISYGQLVQGQQLDLRIPVTGKSARFANAGVPNVAGLDWGSMDGLVVAGDPPTKPISQYKVVGTSFPMPVIPDKVTGKTKWSCDVRLPGMLHARMLRPATLGATLISVGAIDNKRFPNAKVVTKGNLVAVVSPDEWEAVRAAQSLAAQIKWTAWAGLTGSQNLAQTIREHKWGAPDQTRGNQADVAAALGSATKVISASYEQPYIKTCADRPVHGRCRRATGRDRHHLESFRSLAGSACPHGESAWCGRRKSCRALAGSCRAVRENNFRR